MRAFGKQPATYPDLEALPETVVGEIAAGELIVSPRPGSAHLFAASELGVELGNSFSRGRGGPGGWWILDEPELRLGQNILIPDLAGWRRERIPHPATVRHYEIAPDWVCEISSPSTARIDRIKKLPIYLEAGVKNVWLLDPASRVLEVFRAEEHRWVLVAVPIDGEKVRAEPFDAVELDLSVLWGPEEPEAP